MKFELITPTRLVASMDAADVRLPGSAGSFGVLPGHMPLVSTLEPASDVHVVDTDGNEHVFTISAGFVDVKPDMVVVLAEGLVEAAA